MLAFKNGDEAAFSALLSAYESRILNFTYRFTFNRDDAEDLTQEVFVKVYRSREIYEPVSKFSSWIYAIAANTCLDYKKRRKKDIVYNSMPVLPAESDSGKQHPNIPDNSERSIEAAAEQSVSDGAVQKALAALAENQRAALLLKEYENMSYQEIADIMDCSVPSVESLIFRARQNLKKQLAVL